MVKEHRTTAGTWAGGACFLLAVLLGMIALRAANAWLLLIACALLTPVLLSQLMPTGLGQVAVCWHGDRRVAVGQTVIHSFHASNRGRRSTPAFRLSHSHPGFDPVGFVVPGLAPGARAELTVHRVARRRGISDRHEVLLQTTAPFGMAVHRGRIRLNTPVSVHPARARPADLSQIGRADEQGGQPSLAGSEVHGLREWQRGDSLRQVHWRATARHDRLTVAVPETSARLRLGLVLAGRATDPTWEALLATAAWTTLAALEQSREPVRLSAGGANGPAYVGDDPGAVLDWFAALNGTGPPTEESLRAAADWAGRDGLVLVASTRARLEGPLATVHGLLILDPDGRVSPS